MVRDPGSPALRSVAPLVALGPTPQFLGPVMLVENAGKLVGVTSLDSLRQVSTHASGLVQGPAPGGEGPQVAVITSLDGSTYVTVARWGAGRYQGLGLIEIEEKIGETADVKPLDLDAVSASVDTRGAPAALVTITQKGSGFERRVVAVHIDEDDGGGMSDVITRLASPMDGADATTPVDGAPLFAWFPPEPALGRKAEVVTLAVGVTYRAQIVKPREHAVIAELVGLDDLGRALIRPSEPDPRAELAPTAGEIGEPSKS